MKIAVFGAGGVGGYFGGRLAEAGLDVAFIARGKHLAALQARGLRVESVAGDLALHPVRAASDPAEVGPVDCVLVCVKAWQVGEAARAIPPLLGPGTFVVPLENGVEATDELAAVLGPDRVVGGLCKIVSYVAGPGHIRHTGVDPRIEFGEVGGAPPSARVAALHAAFSRARGLSAAVPPDIGVALWEKFLFIVPFSGVGAVTRAAAGDVRSIPQTRALLGAALHEVHAVGVARGVALRPDLVERTLRFVDGMPADATSSMQRDIQAGRPSELEHQVGAVVRLGAAHGVPVPVHAFLYAALLPAERQARAVVASAGNP